MDQDRADMAVITADPAILSGRALAGAVRVPASTVVEYLVRGDPPSALAGDFPSVRPEVAAAIARLSAPALSALSAERDRTGRTRYDRGPGGGRAGPDGWRASAPIDIVRVGGDWLGGTPRLAGHRIGADIAADYLSGDEGRGGFLAAYPHVPPDLVDALAEALRPLLDDLAWLRSLPDR